MQGIDCNLIDILYVMCRIDGSYPIPHSPRCRLEGHDTWLLCPVADDLFPSQTQVDWQPLAIISDDGEETFEIEAILDK